MNLKKTILLLSMTSLIACSEGIENEQTPISAKKGAVEDLVPVEFSVSDQRTVDFTRAATSIITFDANEIVKVFVKPAGATSYTGYDYTTASAGQNVDLTAPSAPDTPPYYPPGEGTKVRAYAYYPSTATTSFSVRGDQTSDADYKASDLMYADDREVTKNGTDGHDHLAMAHQMAQLVITVRAQDGSNINITGVEVLAKTDVTFDPDPDATARVTTTGNVGTIIALNSTGITNSVGTGYIVIPPQIINGVTIKVKTGTEHDDEIATYAFTGTGDFESGNSYTLDLTVSADQLGFTTSINNWNGVGSVNVTPAGNLTILSTDEKPIPAQLFTTQDIEPPFIVKKGNQTVSSDQYTTTWVNNRAAGKAFIIVTGTGNLEGAVGMTSFTITPANGKLVYDVTSVTKKYGNEPFTNPLSNIDKRTEPEYAGKLADGPVTYASSDQTVATIDADGKVTLLKAGSTTITATATNGANYVYSTADPVDNTASYELTVVQGDGSITFGNSAREKTWSSTMSNNKFTQAVTKTGDGAVIYSIPDVNTTNNTCGATIDPSSGEVSFTKPGSVVVTATVSDTERYHYATTTATYTLTVNKTAGYITLNPTSGSVDAGNNATITVASSHGGTLSAAATAGSTSRVGAASVSGNTITVPTNGIVPATVTITVTCAENDYYNAASATYTLTINSGRDIKMNPLWYVAEYNMLTETTMATTDNAGYFWTFSDALSIFGSQNSSYSNYQVGGKTVNGVNYHLPVADEWRSIVPSISSENIWTHDTQGGTYKNKYITVIFGYNTNTKSGIVETSYWKKISDTEIHAIRFLGTPYCSAWKYELGGGWNSSDYGYARITSTLIEQVAASESAAQTWYNSHVWSGSGNIFTSDPNTIQRVFYARGYVNNASGSTATVQVGTAGVYRSATSYNDGSAWAMVVESNVHMTWPMKTLGRTIRLFKDN